jgi:hypothetical protein
LLESSSSGERLARSLEERLRIQVCERAAIDNSREAAAAFSQGVAHVSIVAAVSRPSTSHSRPSTERTDRLEREFVVAILLTVASHRATPVRDCALPECPDTVREARARERELSSGAQLRPAAAGGMQGDIAETT